MKKYIFLFFVCLSFVSCRNESDFFLPEEQASIEQAPPEVEEEDPLPPPPPPPPPPPAEEVPASIALIPFHYRQYYRTTQNALSSTPLDILFSVDNSESMDDYIAAIESNIEVFTSALQNANVSFRIGFLKSTEEQNNSINTQLQGPHPIVDSSSSTNVLGEIKENLNFIRTQAFKGAFEIGTSIFVHAQNSGNLNNFFRANSAKIFFVLSDARDLQWALPSLNHFENFFNNLAGSQRWMYFGIGSHKQNCPTSENIEQPLMYAMSNRSGGRLFSICQSNYTELMHTLITDVFANFTNFSLKNQISTNSSVLFLEQSLQVSVDGNSIPRNPTNGFQWNNEDKFIYFPGSYVPPTSSLIEIRYDYKVF